MFLVLFWEEIFEKLKSLCSLSRVHVVFFGIEKDALIEIVKGVFGLPDSLLDGRKNCVKFCKETPRHLSNWTLPSSGCVTVLDISSK